MGVEHSDERIRRFHRRCVLPSGQYVARHRHKAVRDAGEIDLQAVVLDVVFRPVIGEILPDSEKSPQACARRGDFNVHLAELVKNVRRQIIQTSILLNTMINVKSRDPVNEDSNAIVVPAIIGRLCLVKRSEGARIVCTCRFAGQRVDGKLRHVPIAEYPLPAAEPAMLQLLRNVLKLDHRKTSYIKLRRVSCSRRVLWGCT